jgi:hypothetical protein
MIKKLVIILSLILALIVVRLIDCKIMWGLAKLEYEYLHKNHNSNISSSGSHVIFYGISDYQAAKRKLKSLMDSSDKNIIVVSYYNLLSPAIYLIYSKRDDKTILPWLGEITLEKGLNEIYIYKSDRVKVLSKSKKEKLSTMVLGSWLLLFKPFNIKRNVQNQFLPEYPSFQISSSRYLRKIYIFYFYFPLLLILLITLFYSKKIFLSLYYFLIILILFHFRFVIFSGAGYLIKIFIDLTGFSLVWAILFIIYITGLYFLFFKGISFAWNLRKTERLTFLEKSIILFFLLLPVIFRF